MVPEAAFDKLYVELHYHLQSDNEHDELQCIHGFNLSYYCYSGCFNLPLIFPIILGYLCFSGLKARKQYNTCTLQNGWSKDNIVNNITKYATDSIISHQSVSQSCIHDLP